MATSIDVLPNPDRRLRIDYTPTFSAFCSVGRAPFSGTLAIQFNPDAWLLEFESFERWLATLIDKPMTIEDLCRLVMNTLTEALGDIPMRVTVHARTTVHAPVSASIERGVV